MEAMLAHGTLLLLLAADPAPAAAVKVPELVKLLQAKETKAALQLLKEIGELKGNHEEAKALVRLLRAPEPPRPPEVVEASFLALQGIGSRAVTKELLYLLDTSPYKKDPAIRTGVCRAFQGSADPQGVEAIVDLLRDVDDTVIAAAGEAAGAFRHASEPVRKGLFKEILNVYETTWNLKNSVDPGLRVEQSRAERKWGVIEKPLERSLQLLSNTTQNDPPSWRRFWNKNKRRPWAPLSE